MFLLLTKILRSDVPVENMKIMAVVRKAATEGVVTHQIAILRAIWRNPNMAQKVPAGGSNGFAYVVDYGRALAAVRMRHSRRKPAPVAHSRDQERAYAAR